MLTVWDFRWLMRTLSKHISFMAKISCNFQMSWNWYLKYSRISNKKNEKTNDTINESTKNVTQSNEKVEESESAESDEVIKSDVKGENSKRKKEPSDSIADEPKSNAEKIARAKPNGPYPDCLDCKIIHCVTVSCSSFRAQ